MVEPPPEVNVVLQARADPASPGQPLPDHAYCPKCSYHLKGLTGEHCPECGFALQAFRDPESKIPWVHRARRGRFSAYGQTVEFVMFKHTLLRAEIIRRVSLADAQRFRLVTCLLAWIPFLFVLPIVAAVDFEAFTEIVDWTGWPTLVVAHLGVLFFLVAATGIPSYFFHPRWLPIELQNRGIALSLYACAPLALAPMVAAPLLVFVQSKSLINWAARDDFLGILGTLLSPATVLFWWISTFRLAERLTHNRVRGVIVAVVWPFLSLAIFFLSVVVFPASVWYASLLITSFTETP